MDFELEKLVERERADLASDPGLLEAAKRREHVEAPAVDVDLPGAKPARHVQRFFRRAGPDAAGKAVNRIVGDPHGVVFGVVGDDREHGPENLFLRDGHAIVDVGEDRRLDVKALLEARRTAAAGDELGALFLALVDVAQHRVALVLRTRAARAWSWDRTDRRASAWRAARWPARWPPPAVARGTSMRVQAEHVCPEFCMQLFTPAGTRLVERRIVKHDERRLAAELEAHFLDARRRQATPRDGPPAAIR